MILYYFAFHKCEQLLLTIILRLLTANLFVPVPRRAKNNLRVTRSFGAKRSADAPQDDIVEQAQQSALPRRLNTAVFQGKPSESTGKCVIWASPLHPVLRVRTQMLYYFVHFDISFFRIWVCQYSELSTFCRQLKSFLYINFV